MFDKFISDSDPFIPGKSPFSPAELDELKKKYDSPSPSQQPGPRKQIADVIVEEQPAPVVKTEPVATEVVPDKEIVHPGFKRVRKEKKVNVNGSL